MTKNTLKWILPAFPRTLTPQKVLNCDNQLNFWQYTVCSVPNYTQALKFLHHPGWWGWWHFASLRGDPPIKIRLCSFGFGNIFLKTIVEIYGQFKKKLRHMISHNWIFFFFILLPNVFLRNGGKKCFGLNL